VPNPTAPFTGTVFGVWLMPLTAPALTLDTSLQVWIATLSPDLTKERSVTTHTSPTREDKISRAGVLHLGEGTINGRIRTAFSVSADEWMARLQALIKHQQRYHVFLASPRYYFRVQLNGLSEQSIAGDERQYQVQIPILEVT
jgi:hypothetical protein